MGVRPGVNLKHHGRASSLCPCLEPFSYRHPRTAGDIVDHMGAISFDTTMWGTVWGNIEPEFGWSMAYSDVRFFSTSMQIRINF